MTLYATIRRGSNLYGDDGSTWTVTRVRDRHDGIILVDVIGGNFQHMTI